MKGLSYSLASSVCLGITITLPVEAQITTDGTTNTNLTRTNHRIEINDGDQAQGNLFHSFEQFSVPKGTEAYFNNGLDIVNIFSRVTGSNISNINGLIRANGTANLFIINPRGIIFGQDAALDIGGSFYGSSADSIMFPDGIEFAASNLVKPRLTMNAPIGLRFRDNPGEIVNQSVAGLTVKADNNLALVGGDITLAGGNINLPGKGKVELGSIADNNVVNLEPDNSSFKLGYEAVIDWRNITLNQGATIVTSEADISLRGNQILLFNDGSRIASQVDGSQVGGDIKINARELVLKDKTNISATTFGEGNAGNININVSGSVKVVGTGFIDFQTQFIARALSPDMPLDINTLLEDGVGIFTSTNSEAAAGHVTIKSSFLELEEGAIVASPTFGKGDAGILTIDIADSIVLVGSGIFNNPFLGSEGRGSGIEIDAKNLIISDGGLISTSTFGLGEGAEIKINASEAISILRTASNQLVPTGIFSNSAINNGKAGNIEITTKRLTLRDGGQITSASGIATRVGLVSRGGEGGNIKIIADESITISGRGSSNSNSNSNDIFVSSSAIASNSSTENNAGEVNIKTGQMIISDGGVVSTASSENQEGENSVIGNSGRIEIVADTLTLDNGSISAANNQSNSVIDDEVSTSETDIKLMIEDNLILSNNSSISAQAGENASGGNIDIDANFVVAFPGGNDILANAQQGKGGDINITAQGILGIQERNSEPPNNTNDIDASSQFGLSGDVIFNVPDTNSVQDTPQLSANVIATETVVADVCSAHSEVSSLILQGKGGIPPTPNLPLNAELWLEDSQDRIPDSFELNNPETIHNMELQIQPVQTSVGDIYPARGVIKTKDGKIILTAYDTNNGKARVPSNVLGCEMIDYQKIQ